MDKIYDKIWKLLAAPERWTKSALARNAQGKGTEVNSQTAVSWCVLGAAYKIYGGDSWFEQMEKLSRHLAHNDYSETVRWNNSTATTHTELVEACKAVDI